MKWSEENLAPRLPVRAMRGASGGSKTGCWPSRRDFMFASFVAFAFWAGTLYSNLYPAPLSGRPLVASSSGHGLGGGGGGGGGVTAGLSLAVGSSGGFSPSARLRAAQRLEASSFTCDAGALPAGSAPSTQDARSPDGGGPSCVFEGLYLREGRLYFAVEGGAEGVKAWEGRMPSGYHLGHDMNVAPQEARVAPTVVPLEAVSTWTNGAAPPPLTGYPLLLFSRLNPKNIYHHLWDDQMFAHSVLCRHVPLLAARGEGPGGGGGAGGGCAPGTVPPAAIGLVDGFGERDLEDWAATVAREAYVWPPPPPAGAPGGVARVGYTIMGTRGLCTHRRHCSNIIPAPPVRLFRAHLQALHGVVTALPPPGEPQTAVLVRRTGRRVLTNLDELVELVGVMGYRARVVGPLKDMTVREQYLAFANASLAVFVFGAELGPAWVGMPEGSCTAVLHPAGIMDTLSYWIADKVGLKVSTTVENFKTGADPRLAPRPEWAGREKGGLKFDQYSDVWLYLFNHDFHLDAKDLHRNIWCANNPWPYD